MIFKVYMQNAQLRHVMNKTEKLTKVLLKTVPDQSVVVCYSVDDGSKAADATLQHLWIGIETKRFKCESIQFQLN